VRRIELPTTASSLFLRNLPRQAIGPVVVDQWLNQDIPACIIIGETISDAEELGEDVVAIAEDFMTGFEYEFYLFDSPPTSENPDFHDRTCDRLSALSCLRGLAKKNKKKFVISSTLEAIMGRCPILEKQVSTEIFLQQGMVYSFNDLSKKLASELDYSSEIVCEEPGQFAVRGGIIDIFPVNHTQPVRVDFFGDEIEDIREYDPTSQRTSGTISDIRISSIQQDYSSEREGEFFRHINGSAFWLLPEPENALQSSPLVFHESSNPAANKANFSFAWKRNGSSQDFFLAYSEIDAGCGIFEKSPNHELEISPLIDPLKKDISATYNQSGTTHITSADKILTELRTLQNSSLDVMIAVGTDTEKDRILNLIQDHGIQLKNPKIINAGLRDGFIFRRNKEELYFSNWLKKNSKGFALVTAKEVLGRYRSRRTIKSRKSKVYRREVDHALDFSELVQGDHLVHLQHGICLFDNLGKIEQGSVIEEAISVEFADGVRLHIPLQESHLLTRYVGLNKTKPRLAKLGGKSWSKAKRNAEIAALDLAADLLRLQATRDAEKGHRYSVDNQWQKEFEDLFPHTETADQLRAINDVKKDMESEKPMDRLVCGDVGYGKTEVAMRAAFKAVMDGKQVALLSPTTILCQQHFQSFIDRINEFPVTVEMLSRFRSKTHQEKILQGVKNGSIDILIGTHRLLGKDVDFKDIGLIIIDEEQRFGVEHKENLKRVKAKVDVLTLSATPIPRTLYFAMVGARSFSAIETAPSERRPIRTEVVKNNQDTIKQAIDNEIRRGGQVFYLHNRVKTIDSVAKKLSRSYPKLKIRIGHGQMAERELEDVMTSFVAGEIDILVCTTIIESGLDIPNCNTIIIDGADKFGLSQLYQLRGRVGRFTRQAYAYLLIDQSSAVSDKARKRLSALKQSKSMGAGFRIALRDLELRGAGNLLGSEQSGHVAGVGFELYCRLLKESVSRLKGEEHSLRPSATVRLDFTKDFKISSETSNVFKQGEIETFIPEEYIFEARLRIDAYRKLATFLDPREISEYELELKDRFGKPPKAVKALLMQNQIRCLAEEAGFDRVETADQKLYLRYIKKGTNQEMEFLKKAGKIPILMSTDGFLKLKEIITFLKIYIHGKAKAKI
jgi:transcription-repair coupling factor (superfamily II helicase)